ncbi:MAG: UDP-N-acetylmuramoyl-L-alanine--D-glutamate ligase [Deltaproteobacteria bacterium]|nr:UDP-N-acetylmuramoyl-L-alanine--D-glutamate ligase [Deltaproteobacteria bacterium]
MSRQSSVVSRRPEKDLHGATAVVVGLGSSGDAAARLLVAKGARVIATDSKPNAPEADALRALGVDVVLGGHQGIDFVDADLVVVSPGVPNIPILREAERRGARIVGELELASWYVDADIVAVGGTNGKSTTTELCAALARTSRRPVFAGGNLGTPLSRAVLDGDPGVGAGGVAVVEVSSFQLERVAGFRPRASVLMNVTPDHLDRYASFEAYAIAKGGAFKAQTMEDVAIVPHGDELSARVASLGYGRLETIDGPAPASVGVEGDRLVDRATSVTMPLSMLHLEGRHNVTNLCAAWAAARAVIGDASGFPAAVDAFRGLAHRTAFVAELDGVRYYDDSKGTNVGASVTALLGLREPRGVLIAGGRDKGGSYGPLVAALGEKGRGVVVIGEAADLIADAVLRGLGPSFPLVRAGTMEEAVERAAELAQRGDAVLLSPACSSYDMFKDYKQRGDVFVAAVRARAGGSR